MKGPASAAFIYMSGRALLAGTGSLYTSESVARQNSQKPNRSYTNVYEWRRQLKSLGRQGFLDYIPSHPGRGIKQITPGQEKAVLDTWKDNPGFGPGQVRNQLRRQAITISIRTIRSIMQANGYKTAN